MAARLADMYISMHQSGLGECTHPLVSVKCAHKDRDLFASIHASAKHRCMRARRPSLHSAAVGVVVVALGRCPLQKGWIDLRRFRPLVDSLERASDVCVMWTRCLIHARLTQSLRLRCRLAKAR